MTSNLPLKLLLHVRMEVGRFSLRLNARGSVANYRMRVDNPTAAPCDIQTFGPGDSTWVMPDGARLVQVSIIGAGGGGTSGWRGTPLVVGDGAGIPGVGGEGGGWAVMTFPASNLPSEVPLTVGVGGAGDTGATADGSFGAGATDGGATSFDGYLTVAGGRCTRPDGEIRAAIRSMLTPGAPLAVDAAGCPAGGLGGSLIIVNEGDPVTIGNGAPGGRSTLTGNPAADGGAVDGVIDGGDGDSQASGQPTPGNAGGGGAASLTGPAGKGGDGGDWGAGGGGGGASGDGYPSGDGGTGGDGICTVVTYF